MIRGSLRTLISTEILKKQQQKLLKKFIGTSTNILQQKQQIAHEDDIVLRSPFPDILIPNWTIDQYVWKNLNRWSDKVAVVDGITDHQYTFAQLRDYTRVLAYQLQTVFKLHHGDTFAVCLPNCPEFPLISLAGLEAGNIVTTINPIYTADEISKQLIDSAAKVIFGMAQMSEILKKAVNLTKRDIKVVYVKEKSDESVPADGINFHELISVKGIDFSKFKDPQATNQDIAFLPYSSGTTGKPKGVLLTHENIVSNGIMVNADTGTGSYCQETTDDYQDVLPCVLPFFHIYGLTVTLFSKLALGNKIVTLPKFTPDTFLNAQEKYKGTVLHLVPPIIIFLNNYDKFGPQHSKSIKYVTTGAAPLGAHDVERFFKKVPGIGFFQGYGLTETSPVCTRQQVGSTNFGSVGHLSPNTEGKIVAVGDPSFKGLGPNQSGEFLVRGPHIMKGYHNNQEATRETLLEDGFLRTGDIAHYDENMEFYITDRLKELIKVKGFQVAPAELEEVLRDHPKIADAAVVGIAHPTSGEVPKAFVVKKPNHEVTEKEIQDFVAEKVATFKRIDGGVQFLNAIPKNATGKILRRVIKEQYC